METMRCAGAANSIDLPSPSVSLIGSGAGVAVGAGGSVGRVQWARVVGAAVGAAVGAEGAIGWGAAAGAQALSSDRDQHQYRQ